MRNTSSIRYLCVYVLLVALSSTTIGVTNGYLQFDHDDSTDCKKRAEAGECIDNETTFAECSMSCATHYDPGDVADKPYEELGYTQPPGYRLQGEAKDPDEFYDLEHQLANGKALDFERFEAMVTLIVAVPLIPGMAQYYYDMMDQVRNAFPHVLEIIMIPFQLKSQTTNPKLSKKSKIHLLETVKAEDLEENIVIEYAQGTFTEGEILHRDRVTVYLLAASSPYTEKRISPTLMMIEKLVGHYVKELSWKTKEL